MSNIHEEFMKACELLKTEYSDIANATLSREDVNKVMRFYLNELKIDISKLAIVHVAGSKGKGTTCMYTEAILRAHGLKTGLYTSPHLQSICERFQINGCMISEDLFVQHFYPIWNKMMEIRQRSNKPDYIPNWPGFFRFLTIMCFSIMISQNIDILVLEVGLGGRLDATNIVETPLVTGITLLDLEHTNILGNTIEQIAYEKAGIIKHNIPVYSVLQDERAKTVLCHSASTMNAPIEFYSQMDLPFLSKIKSILHIPEYLYDNMTISYYMSLVVLKHFNIIYNENICLSFLKHVCTPARGQVISISPSLTLYVDGAHTIKSMEKTSLWMDQCICESKKKQSNTLSVLFFYCGRDKDMYHLLNTITHVPIDIIIFTSVTYCKVEYSPVHIDTIQECLLKHHIEETIVTPSPSFIDKNSVFDSMSVDTSILQNQLYLYNLFYALKQHEGGHPISNYYVSPTIHDSYTYILNTYNHDISRPMNIFVTGSLYLCGDILNEIHYIQ